MITEDYVSFEVAKLLRDKGFNEPCRGVYEEKVLHINGLLLKIYLKENIITILTLEIKKLHSVKKLLI